MSDSSGSSARVPPVAAGVRASWSQVPHRVHEWLADLLGSPVVESHAQVGGFSPGAAARLVCADGARAFAKAVSSSMNADSARMYRHESGVVQALPPHPSLPHLLGTYDDGTWVVLAFKDVDGRHPRLPWQADDLTLVLDTLTELGELLDPSPVLRAPAPPPHGSLPAATGSPAPAPAPVGMDLRPDLGGPPVPTLEPSPPARTATSTPPPAAAPGCADLRTELAAMANLWQELATHPPADLDPWLRRHLPDLVAWAQHPAPDGAALVHLDLRADNLLITPSGVVCVLDWANAGTGPGWLDPTYLMLEVRAHGGHDVDRLLAEHPLTRSVDREQVTWAVLGVAAMFEQHCRQPAPPGLPTIRAFQRAYAHTATGWLRARLPSWP